MTHSHNHKEGCCCSCHQEHGSCGCCSDQKHDSCCGEHKDDCQKDFAKHLLCVADEAWMELLKDKIKTNILASCGDQLDQIARIVSEGNKMRWEHKIAIQKAKDEFRSNLENILGCPSGSCKK